MWCKRAAAICSAAAIFASVGCGPAKDVKTGARPPQLAKHLYAADLLPADLDVVLRVDMARLRAGSVRLSRRRSRRARRRRAAKASSPRRW